MAGNNENREKSLNETKPLDLFPKKGQNIILGR